MNKLHITTAAKADLHGIRRYITEELGNPLAAQATVTRITKAIRLLLLHAQLGTPLASIADSERDYRYLVSGSYMIFYRAQGSDVYIDRVLYGRGSYMSVLFQDLPSEGEDE